MSKPLRLITDHHLLELVVIRRLAKDTKGLGYLSALDYSRMHSIHNKPVQIIEEPDEDDYTMWFAREMRQPPEHSDHMRF